MSKRKAFWNTSIRHRIPGSVNGKLMDAEVSASGVRLIETVTNSEMRWVPWAELHKLAQIGSPSIPPSLHGPLNESAPLRILLAEEES